MYRNLYLYNCTALYICNCTVSGKLNSSLEIVKLTKKKFPLLQKLFFFAQFLIEICKDRVISALGLLNLQSFLASDNFNPVILTFF